MRLESIIVYRPCDGLDQASPDLKFDPSPGHLLSRHIDFRRSGYWCLALETESIPDQMEEIAIMGRSQSTSVCK